MRYNLTSLLFEENVEDELHVFDFDDTLGVTDSPTFIAAVEFTGGDPEDPSSYIPITNLADRVTASTGDLGAPSDIGFTSGGITGNKVSGESPIIDGAEVIMVDTAQYRDWDNKYIRPAGHAKIVVGGDIEGKIKKAARAMAKDGRTGEIHVRDFSPSSTLGAVKPISTTLQRLKDVESQGGNTAVVTARKGETDLDAFGGAKIPAQNSKDIENFVRDQTGAVPDDVFGAADISNAGPENKRKLVKWLIAKNNPEEVHFYDDDPGNVAAVAQLCNDEDVEGLELNLYGGEFDHEGITSPTTCGPVENRWLKLAGLLKG